AADGELDVIARAMSEIDAEVGAIVGAVIAKDALLLLVRYRREKIRPFAVLRDAEGVRVDVARVEDLVHGIVDRASVRHVLKPGGRRTRDALLTRDDLARCVHVLALVVR